MHAPAISGDLTTQYLDLLKKVLTGHLYDEAAWLLLDPARKPKSAYERVRQTILRALKRKSLYLVKQRAFDPKQFDEGLQWPLIGYTMVGLRRLDNLQDCIERVLEHDVAGDFVECGVWRGGAAMFAKAVLNLHGAADRTVWLADSFAGMPTPTAKDIGDPDLSDSSFLAVSLDTVQANFRRFALLDERVKFIKGWFCDTLPTAPIERIAILRLDGDHYSSTMDALTALYDKVSVGGFVIIDDYHSFPTCSSAVHQFFADRKINPDLTPIDSHAVYWRKS